MAASKSKKPSQSASKPIKEVLSKSGMIAHIAQGTGVAVREVRLVLDALEDAVTESLHKKGAGSFVLPGLLKITTVKVPARPKRKGVNPFTKQEQWFEAKPATVRVKIRALKRLKDAAF